MHPDKNKTAGAEESFRILVAMYEVSVINLTAFEWEYTVQATTLSC